MRIGADNPPRLTPLGAIAPSGNPGRFQALLDTGSSSTSLALGERAAGFAELGVFGRSHATPGGETPRNLAPARARAVNADLDPQQPRSDAVTPREVAPATAGRIERAPADTGSEGLSVARASRIAEGVSQPAVLAAWRMEAERGPTEQIDAVSMLPLDRARRMAGTSSRFETAVLGHRDRKAWLIARVASPTALVELLRRALGLAKADGTTLDQATINGQVMTAKQIKDRIAPWP